MKPLLAPQSMTSPDHSGLAWTAPPDFPSQVLLVHANPRALGYKCRTLHLLSKDLPSVAEPLYSAEPDTLHPPDIPTNPSSLAPLPPAPAIAALLRA
ncbi:hypothetical protein E4T56_gene1821 [Termitomyces sp. T112]|nr:hypothetical protein E4T56_gene1821 [Termitomyces sp. T112]